MMRSLVVVLLAISSLVVFASPAMAVINWAGDAEPSDGSDHDSMMDLYVWAVVYKAGVTNVSPPEGIIAELVFQTDLMSSSDGVEMEVESSAQSPSGAQALRFVGLIPKAQLVGATSISVVATFYDLTDATVVTAGDVHGDPAPQTYSLSSGATGVSTPSALPARSALHPSVPNPFNPSTTIHFDLEKAGEVVLAVYDLTGRRVQTLVQSSLNAGNHEAIWRGQDESGRPMPSGVYLYKLAAGSYVETRRMTLLK